MSGAEIWAASTVDALEPVHCSTYHLQVAQAKVAGPQLGKGRVHSVRAHGLVLEIVRRWKRYAWIDLDAMIVEA